MVTKPSTKWDDPPAWLMGLTGAVPGPKSSPKEAQEDDCISLKDLSFLFGGNLRMTNHYKAI